MTINWPIIISIIITLFFVIIFIVFAIKKNKSYNEPTFILGYFRRISGDINQPPVFQNIKTLEGTKIVYYNRENKVIDMGIRTKNQQIQNHSKSSLNKLISSSKVLTWISTGHANEKFSRININYHAVHTFLKLKNKIYYQNSYYFSNGDISSAIYIKQ